MEWEMNLPLHELLIEGKNRQNNICFKEALLVGCCSIWNHRNKIIFENEDISIDYRQMSGHVQGIIFNHYV
jgi:hypothetical protein